MLNFFALFCTEASASVTVFNVEQAGWIAVSSLVVSFITLLIKIGECIIKSIKSTALLQYTEKSDNQPVNNMQYYHIQLSMLKGRNIKDALLTLESYEYAGVETLLNLPMRWMNQECLSVDDYRKNIFSKHTINYIDLFVEDLNTNNIYGVFNVPDATKMGNIYLGNIKNSNSTKKLILKIRIDSSSKLTNSYFIAKITYNSNPKPGEKNYNVEVKPIEDASK